MHMVKEKIQIVSKKIQWKKFILLEGVYTYKFAYNCHLSFKEIACIYLQLHQKYIHWTYLFSQIFASTVSSNFGVSNRGKMVTHWLIFNYFIIPYVRLSIFSWIIGPCSFLPLPLFIFCWLLAFAYWFIIVLHVLLLALCHEGGKIWQ